MRNIRSEWQMKVQKCILIRLGKEITLSTRLQWKACLLSFGAFYAIVGLGNSFCIVIGYSIKLILLNYLPLGSFRAESTSDKPKVNKEELEIKVLAFPMRIPVVHYGMQKCQ